MTPLEAMKALKENDLEAELAVIDYIEQAKRILHEGLPGAAQAIINLSKFANSEQIKLAAAKYVIDRGLGPVNGKSTNDNENDPISKLINDIMENERRV
jgi:hypothetical protein